MDDVQQGGIRDPYGIERIHAPRMIMKIMNLLVVVDNPTMVDPPMMIRKVNMMVDQ